MSDTLASEKWTHTEIPSKTLMKEFQVLDQNGKVIASLKEFIHEEDGASAERRNRMRERARAIAALPDMVRALSTALNWIPRAARNQVEQAMFRAGILEEGEDEYLMCSEPGCVVHDGTVTVCEWCQRAICLEHDDVLENRDIDSGLTLCQPCGEIYDHQAREKELTEALKMLLGAATDSTVTEEQRLMRQANAVAVLNRPEEK